MNTYVNMCMFDHISSVKIWNPSKENCSDDVSIFFMQKAVCICLLRY